MTSGPAPVALVDLAADVSGSMPQRIRNRDGTMQSRFQSFQAALARVLRAGRERAEGAARTGGAGSAEAVIFAYAFGLSVSSHVVDLLALLTAADGVTTPAEIERLKRRYADEIRQRYAGYGEVASVANSLGLGGLVNQYASSARASAEAEVRGKIKEEVMRRVRERLAARGAVAMTLTELAHVWSAEPASFILDLAARSKRSREAGIGQGGL